MEHDFENAGMEVEEIPVATLDAALIKVKELDVDHKIKDSIKKEASALLTAAKEDLMKLLAAAGKKRWEVDGVGGFTMFDKFQYKIPDGPDNKELLLNWLKSEKCSSLLGADPRDIYLKYATVNSMALQGFCKTIMEEGAEIGEIIQIPGLTEPVNKPQLKSLPKRK